MTPLFEVQAVEWDTPAPEGFDGLLITSANAVRHAGRGLRALEALPVHAVGEATADVARQLGLHVATVGTGSVDDLLSELPGSSRLLHLTGEHRRAPAGTGPRIHSITVYRSIALPPPLELLRAEDVVILVHSPRAGERLAEIVTQRTTLRVVAISSAAETACGAGWRTLVHADKPVDRQLLSLAAGLCEEDGSS